MKHLTCLTIILFFITGFAVAQPDVTNTGILKLTGITDTFFITGNLANTNTATLANDGNVLVKGNLSNSQTTDLSGTGKIFLSGNSGQNLSSTLALNNLTITKSGGAVVLLTNAAINGTLNFVSGNIQTGIYSVILPAAGMLTNAAQNTGWVAGNLQKNVPTGAVTRLFEIGDASVYAPISIVFPNITTAGNLTAKTTAGDHPNINISVIDPLKSVNRYWNVINSGAVFNAYNATFNFVAADIDAGANTSNFGVSLYDGTNWSILPSSLRNPTNTRAAGTTAFGSFAIGETYIVVPVTFNNLKAYPQEQNVIVEWTVENEINTRIYEIERSANGINFYGFQTKAANGGPFYQIVDHNPFKGDNFYRIKAIDNNGTLKYSNIAKVSFENERTGIAIYPNPVRDNNLNLQVNNLDKGNYILEIFNVSGQRVKREMLKHSGGTVKHLLTLDNKIAAGKYELRILGSGKKLSSSFIKE